MAQARPCKQIGLPGYQSAFAGRGFGERVPAINHQLSAIRYQHLQSYGRGGGVVGRGLGAGVALGVGVGVGVGVAVGVGVCVAVAVAVAVAVGVNVGVAVG